MHSKYLQNILTSAELRNKGVTSYKQRRLIAQGELIKTDHATYTYRDFAESLTAYEKPLARLVSTVKSCKNPLVSHVSAALWYGAPLIESPKKVHLTYKSSLNYRKSQVSFHQDDGRAFASARLVSGVLVTAPDKTLHDCISSLPLLEATNITNYFLTQQLLSFAAVQEVLGWRRRRGKYNAEKIAGRLNIQCESALETLVLHWIYEWEIELPQQQVWLDCGSGRRYRVDFVWLGQKVIVEADGQVKYSGKYGNAEEIIRAERARQRELERLGWKFIRVDWSTMMNNPEYLRDQLFALGVG